MKGLLPRRSRARALILLLAVTVPVTPYAPHSLSEAGGRLRRRGASAGARTRPLGASVASRDDVSSKVATPTKWLKRKPSPGAVVEKYKEYAPIREMGFNRSALIQFFSRRPQVVAARLLTITRVLNRLKKEWERQEALPLEERTRGSIVRKELSDLGPCFVKIGQTLSQRPDIVGDEAAEELKLLQTENEPFSDDVAMHLIGSELGWTGPIAPGVVPSGSDPEGEPLFASISKTCIASASLGQVYRAELREDFDLGTSKFLETMAVEEGSADINAGDDATGSEEKPMKRLAGKGRFVAVKVQRPEAVRQIALDWTCLALALESLEIYWRYVRPSGFEYSLGDIADEIASGIFQELNYIQEAKNAETFVESLKFLGFVDAPTTIHQLTSPCVLTTSWVDGAHLRDLSPEKAQDMVTMAVEACTASLVLTGYVHADPHEGNIMLADNGRLVFLDFGLMSNVQGDIMEAFAQGIQACLAEDYTALSSAFQATGFVDTPIQYRLDESEPFVIGEIEVFAAELRKKMQTTEGGESRFGALASVLSSLGKQWRMYTPPYVLLLIRTFLTLEGIAAKVDPNFNIYEVSLPWAIKRSLAPATPDGVAVLRSTVLTDNNQIQWNKLMGLVEEMSSAAQSAVDDAVATTTEALTEATEAAMETMGMDFKSTERNSTSSTPPAAVAESPPKPSSNGKSQRGMQAVASLLGSPEGATLRRIAADLDSTDLFLRLMNREGRVVRRICAKLLAQKIRTKMSLSGGEGSDDDIETLWDQDRDLPTNAAALPPSPSPIQSEEQKEAAERLARMYGVSSQDAPTTITSSTSQSINENRLTTMPVPQEFQALQARQKRWTRTMMRQLLSIHLQKQLNAGWRGFYGVSALFYVTLRVLTEATIRATLGLCRDVAMGPLRWVRAWNRRRRNRRGGNTDSEATTLVAMAGGIPVLATSSPNTDADMEGIPGAAD